MKPLLLILALAFSVSGQDINRCKETSTQATVYFYRVDEKMALAKRYTKLNIDDSKVLAMPEGSYVGFYLTPGQHTMVMGHRKETDQLFIAQAGATYYYQISYTYKGDLKTLTAIPDESQAVYQMRKLKPLSSDNIKDKTIARCDAL
ncbi:MAG: DUF2846 domain-containing protein [Pyrinomonadaceae bacterium]